LSAENRPESVASTSTPATGTRLTLGRILAFGGLAAVVGVILLPQLVSSRWVYGPMIDRLGAGNFRLSIDSVELNWLRPIRFSGVSISEAVGGKKGAPDVKPAEPLVEVAEIATDRGLIGFILSGRELGKLEIIRPVIDVSLFDENGGLSDLLTAIGGHADDRQTAPEKPVSRPAPPSLTIAVAVRQMRLSVRQTGLKEPLVVVPPLDLDVTYGVEDDRAVLEIQPTRLLDQVALTPELVRLGLGHVVPVLANAAWLDGSVSAEIGSLRIPLVKPVESTGTARITFHSVRAGIADPAIRDGLERIATLFGRDAVAEIVLADGSVADVSMSESVIHHQGMKIGLPKLDPRLQLTSEGDVSLADRSLDLLVTIPIPIELLARRETVRGLGVPMIGLPIRGKLGSPELVWSQLRGDSGGVIGAIGGQLSEESPTTAKIMSALGGAVGGEADEAIRFSLDAIRSIRQRLADRNQSPSPIEDQDQADDNQQAAGNASESPDAEEAAPRRQPIRDRLRSRRQNATDNP